MIRGRTYSILIVLLLIGGGACIWGSVTLSKWNLGQLAGAVTFLLAAFVGMTSIVSAKSRERLLARRVEKMIAQTKLGFIEAADSDSAELVAAVNELVSYAEKSVSDALLQVKELEIQLKVATAQRQHAEAIIYSISDGVLVTDSFDELVLANESAARTFSFDLSRASRAPVDRMISDAKMIELIREMRQSDSTGRRIVEHQIRTGDGVRTFKITLSCVANRTDVPSGVVAVLHDMTKEKEVAEMKNDFVSNVSHELRTPLASSKAYVEMLIDGEADDEKTKGEFYEVIQNEANRLGRLIDNILNISRIESGLVKVNKQPQSLMVIMKEAIEVITPQAKLKQIKIEEKLTPVFYQTQADKDMLYQAVLNLLSNAIKYTPEGGTVTVQTEVDEQKKKVIGRISDTGVGIPPKDLPFVFDKFYRAEANNRMAKGTGLGLSLVKHIVETVHQGRIFAESQVGKGSCFGFELDLCE
ncbi:MAG TPA: ATP-binding protein [Tepidisphaeraceae bacterium]|nr:ATP-binding protein [Tepidisphaeraceae bacterium]